MTASKDRVILHCDMNGFYASVELLEHPELKDKPMAVSGDPDNRHGIILAKNQLAKEYGVVTAETIWQGEKKRPPPPPFSKRSALSFSWYVLTWPSTDITAVSSTPYINVLPIWLSLSA